MKPCGDVAQPGRSDVERGLTIRERAQDTRAPSDLAQDTLKRVVGAFEGWELTERGKRELKRVQKPLMQSV
jgi:hypothetical protein